MLSIAAMSSGQEAYYTELAREDYYLQGGEPEGFWLGRACEKLGLEGAVSREELRALFRGFAPDGSGKLVQNAGKENRQAGWDLCLSVPKTVSVVWSQAGQTEREAIQEVVRTAVESTIGFIEEEAAFSRTGKGGAGRVQAKLAVAAFPHGTSRALDPQYHVHCLVLNVGVDENADTRTVLSKPFYQYKMLAGAYFRVELARELEKRLGLVSERPVNTKGEPRCWFELKGVSPSLCKEFSKRRQAIERELGAQGLETASAAAVAALGTREKKTVIPARSELFSNWRKEGQARGFTAQSVAALLGQAETTNPEQEYRLAFKAAVEKLSFGESYFSERDVVRHTLEAAQGRGIDARTVVERVRAELEEGKKLVHLGEYTYTTKATLAAEKELLSAVDGLRESRFRPISTSLVEKAITKTWRPEVEGQSVVNRAVRKALQRDEGFRLNGEQAEAVRHLTRSPGRVKVVSGIAGAGKTALLRAVREVYEQAGYRVLGCAVAGTAAKNLGKDTGIASDTVRMRLLQLYPKASRVWQHHAKQLLHAALGKRTFRPDVLEIDRKTVLVVDEAAMVGTRDFALLAQAVRGGGGILICAGDQRQLPSIEAGGGFAAIAKRVGQTTLEEVVRQREPWERDAVRKLAQGKGQEVLTEYAREGQLHVERSRDAACHRLVSDWKARGGVDDPKRHVIFVSTNQEVDRYNDLVQAERARAGKLDRSQAVSVGQEKIYVGERVVFLKKSRTLGVENGDVGTVVALRRGALKTELAVQVDGQTKVLRVPVATVVGKSYQTLRRGYAFTTHKLQGATVENAYVHLGGATTDREMVYVQGSRHRERLQIYTDAWEAGPALTKLVRQMTGEGHAEEARKPRAPDYSPLLDAVKRSSAKELAHEVRGELRLERK